MKGFFFIFKCRGNNNSDYHAFHLANIEPFVRAVHSDEYLKLEKLVIKSFMGINLTLWSIIDFSVSLSHLCNTKFLWKLNPLISVKNMFINGISPESNIHVWFHILNTTGVYKHASLLYV